MPARRYEIYYEKIRFRNADHPRYWVVVEDPYIDAVSGRVLVAILPLSSQFDLFQDAIDHPIRATDDGFTTTGLTKARLVCDSGIRSARRPGSLVP